MMVEFIYLEKVLQVIHIIEDILEELLQMFEQPISGMVHLVDFILFKFVWKYLPVKINCKSTDWFLYVTNFH